MRLNRPRFWGEKNLIAYFLYPLSIITKLFNLFKKFYLKKEFNIKIICVGNIFIGGTGKTSISIQINKILKKKFKTVFIKKNYQNQTDEVKILKKVGKVISQNNRIESLKIAEKKKFQIAILDDGLQQKNISYNLKIVCFNTKEAIGNGFLLPAGPLREDFSEIQNCDLVFLNGKDKNNLLYNKIKTSNKKIILFRSNYEPENLKKFNRKKHYLMFCGIGNPHEFENTLKKNKFKLKKKIIYPDHYEFLDKDIKILKNLAKKENLNIITTEKDYMRLNTNQRRGINYLKVELKIENLQKLKKILYKINEKN